MSKDLRTFLDLLEKKMPQDLIRVQREVDPKYEAAAVVNKLEKIGKYPVVLFEQIKGSKVPLLMNIHATYERMALALGTTLENMNADYRAKENNLIKAKQSGNAPVKEIAITGDKVDLGLLPITTLHELDAGAYVDAGICIMRDPELGHTNTGVFRHMVQRKDQLGVQFSETAQSRYIWQKYERAGRKMEVAISIGHHPAFDLGAVANTSPGVDQFEVCGGIMGEPLEVVDAETVDLKVPARAEIVLEGYIPPGIRESEAPYGEFPGTYGKKRENPIIKITAITMRREPIFQNGFSGHRDNLLWGSFSRQNVIMRFARHAVPSLVDIHMPLSGRTRFVCYLKIKKTVEGEAKNAIMGAFAADPFLKYVIVVDDDVDIHDDSDVLHAIATRVKADKDIFVIPEAKGSPLDPTVRDPALVAKMGIDATRKLDYPIEIKVPGVDAIDLKSFGITL